MKLSPSSLSTFLWSICKRHSLHLSALICLVLLWASLVSLNSYALKLLLDAMIQEREDLWPSALFFVSLTMATSFTLRLYDYIMLKVFPQIKADIISNFFEYLGTYSYAYFQQNFSGNLANKIHDVSKGTVTIIQCIIDQFCARIFSLFIGTIAMFLVHPAFAICLMIWILCFSATATFFSRKSQKYSANFSSCRSQIIGNMVDSISNIFNVKLFARESYENGLLQTSLNHLIGAERRLQWFLLKVKAVYSLSVTALTGCIMWLLIYERSLGRITVGDASLILTLTLILVRDIFLITNQFVAFSDEVGTCKEALAMLSSPLEPVHQSDYAPLKVTQGTIVFEQVHFEYKKGQNLFVDQSVIIPGGAKIGLVGLSGSGKTTFVHLILRLFDFHFGNIFIDGQNINCVTQESLRNQIAMIPQDPILFHRSIRENIRYGRLDATDEEVIECSKRARCHEFITKLKEGYDSLVGERGVKLSGGQRQRIAIARAMLKNAPILILDEATSSLDSETERSIQESFISLMKGKTTIIVAHRLSTLHHVDRILVFKEGRIVEDGTHAELIHQNHHFKNLWDLQVQREMKGERTPNEDFPLNR